jgi:hypothetical protein
MNEVLGEEKDWRDDGLFVSVIFFLKLLQFPEGCFLDKPLLGFKIKFGKGFINFNDDDIGGLLLPTSALLRDFIRRFLA